MCLKLFHLALLFHLVFLRTFAQDVIYSGFVPNVQVDGELSGKVFFFLQTGSELLFFEHSSSKPKNAAEMLNFDLVGGIHFDAGPNWNFAFSAVARRLRPFSERKGIELRPWQQVTHIARFGKYRLRNRFRAEQRFVQRQEGEPFDFDLRLRYRLSLDFPLEGERLDDKEFYLNISAEWLLTPTRERALFYHNPRGYAGIGYRLNPKIRLEMGPEFRTRNRRENGNDEHIWYWRATWVQTI